jgi:hypothetical protein
VIHNHRIETLGSLVSKIDIVGKITHISDIGGAMSDGPHRSLPMRKAWKDLAKCAEQPTYLWSNLDAATFEGGAHNEFSRVTGALRDYALAGMLHLEHFATLRQSAQYTLVKRRALSELARSLNEPVETVGDRFDRLLRQHALEWSAFKEGLSETSFVKKWVNAVS